MNECCSSVFKMGERRIEALQQLLICYRINRQVSEKLFTELERTEKGWGKIKTDAV